MLVVVIGAGGTGSYAIPDLYTILNATGEEHTLLIADGDIVEDKNLTRQAFYPQDLNKNKADVLLERVKKKDSGKVNVFSYNKYIKKVSELLKIVKAMKEVDNYNEVVFVCCADNNMVRYRIEIASYILRERTDLEMITVIDSGNSEFTGQCLVSLLDKNVKVNIENDLSGITVRGNKLDSILARLDGELEDRLTYADFEMSCEDNVISNPQNIGTNMLAGSVIVNVFINLLYTGTSNSLAFESRYGTVRELERVSLGTINETLEMMIGYEHFIDELVLDDGFEITLNS